MRNANVPTVSPLGRSAAPPNLWRTAPGLRVLTILLAAVAGGACGDGDSSANGGMGGTTNSTLPDPGTGGVPGTGGTVTSGSGGTRTSGSGDTAAVCIGDTSALGSLGLRATPPVIAPGQSSTLSWDSRTATTLTIEPGVGSVLGKTSQVVTPTQTTTYTLTNDGLLQDKVTVTITRKALVQTGSLLEARSNHTATLLADGKVLVAGGWSLGQALSSAELYDPATGAFVTAGSMRVTRGGHTATLLANGKVLFVGGVDGASGQPGAELYDPVNHAFTPTSSPSVARGAHTATLLASGQVLIAGGLSGTTVLASAEIYDPTTNAFSATGNLTIARYQHAAALLPSGKVLLLGGYLPPADTSNYDGLRSAELYDPASGVFTATGDMASKRAAPVATLLADGTVLVGGGWHGFEGYFDSNLLELYEPSSGKFSATGNMAVKRALFTMTLLNDGAVFMAGGLQHRISAADGYLANAEIYDPSARASALAACLPHGLVSHTATTLSDGRVLLAGGRGGASSSSELANAYLYQ